jgi:hypothetical protein
MSSHAENGAMEAAKPRPARRVTAAFSSSTSCDSLSALTTIWKHCSR